MQDQIMISDSNSTALMGQWHLYHTTEERLAENRAKSKQHYEKYALFLFIHYISLKSVLEIKL